MDPHVKRMADVLEQCRQETNSEMYDSITYDEDGNDVETCPALKVDIDGRIINILLFDVPGIHDHFSIIVDARPDFTMSLRREERWDWVLKSLKRVEDHIVGVPEFDKHFLIGGQPTDHVVHFLQKHEVRGMIQSMEPFLNLACDVGFMRASFPLTPSTHYELKDLRDRVLTMKRLAEAAESKP